MKKGPTKKQQALLQFISEYTEEHNLSPSYREIMTAMHLRSVSAVAEHINNCVKAGYLEKVDNQARTLRVIPIETHEETVKFFNQKLSELDQLLSAKEAELDEVDLKVDFSAAGAQESGSGELLTKRSKNILLAEKNALEHQIDTLKAAADILEIDL